MLSGKTLWVFDSAKNRRVCAKLFCLKQKEKRKSWAQINSYRRIYSSGSRVLVEESVHAHQSHCYLSHCILNYLRSASAASRDGNIYTIEKYNDSKLQCAFAVCVCLGALCLR